jgi:hypothetical protein
MAADWKLRTRNPGAVQRPSTQPWGFLGIGVKTGFAHGGWVATLRASHALTFTAARRDE